MSHPLLAAYYLMPKLSLIGGYACVGPSEVRLAAQLCVVRFRDVPGRSGTFRALLFRAEDTPVPVHAVFPSSPSEGKISNALAAPPPRSQSTRVTTLTASKCCRLTDTTRI